MRAPRGGPRIAQRLSLQQPPHQHSQHILIAAILPRVQHRQVLGRVAGQVLRAGGIAALRPLQRTAATLGDGAALMATAAASAAGGGERRPVCPPNRGPGLPGPGLPPTLRGGSLGLGLGSAS